ncbi:hypothetical protein [Chitinophaga nivalis]|uniref:Uncharacterized protein n=1 Tax=Chitinophaga nivalis TaxID=2991709 RepID=A0ABT3IM96_9BACT|nr:hypothetical protein [Chitinophaga nivalis]MCW3465223.1 hypothetical protein [Chitinophaga nivalis]MCW3485085.1 hypothetical protein [Chitinophaga nivalis]
MVEVFKTNVGEVARAKELVILLQQHFPDSRINFDLEDRDRILRIEGPCCLPSAVVLLLEQQGVRCVVLE